MAFDSRLRRLVCLSTALFAGAAFADNGSALTIRARLSGYQEVPVVSTGANGSFKGRIAKTEDSIEYEFAYSGLQGTVTQAHIHLGQRGVNGPGFAIATKQ